MKKHIVCGGAALALTGLTVAMFSVAAAHTRERAHEPIATSSMPAASRIIDTVVVERRRYLARTTACSGCLTPGYSVWRPQ